MKSGTILRIARPTDNLTVIAAMYPKGLNLTVLAQFQDHDGFDGVILGHPSSIPSRNGFSPWGASVWPWRTMWPR